jgi:drug/metabolite transporter (DMT)-like permease
LLGIAAATGFGFVAAVIKELSSHLSQGPSGVFSNWSPYVLLLSGAAAMFLASNAFQAGSLAASQPGLTIVDPLVASALGVVLFGERLNHAPAAFTGEILAVALLVISVVVLSRSPLVRDDTQDDNGPELPAELASVPREQRESVGPPCAST